MDLIRMVLPTPMMRPSTVAVLAVTVERDLARVEATGGPSAAVVFAQLALHAVDDRGGDLAQISVAGAVPVLETGLGDILEVVGHGSLLGLVGHGQVGTDRGARESARVSRMPRRRARKLTL